MQFSPFALLLLLLLSLFSLRVINISHICIFLHYENTCPPLSLPLHFHFHLPLSSPRSFIPPHHYYCYYHSHYELLNYFFFTLIFALLFQYHYYYYSIAMLTLWMTITLLNLIIRFYNASIFVSWVYLCLNYWCYTCTVTLY